MRKILLAMVAIGTAFAATSPAAAIEGCGPGGHRGPYGHCRPNGYRYGPPGARVGVFYRGRGYWDGHRYWQRRERWHGGWRYR